MCKQLLIKNARVVLPGRTLERGWLLAEDGIIAAFEYGDPPDYSDAEVIRGEGLTLLPGFIDLHAHGGNGFDVMEGNAEALHGMARFFAAGGVTSFLATTWTDTGANITRALKAVADVMNSPAGGAQLLGAHLEGPFLNPKRCGAQHSSLIRRADPAEARPWLEMNVIRLLALAPEYEGNHWLITESAKRGVTVSVAHSDATYGQMTAAADMGLSHATHSFNAMSPLHHREPGVVGALLSIDSISCELICDLLHVHPAAIDVLWRCKPRDKLVLVTDSVKIAGLPDGSYHFSHQDVEMKDGAVRIVADGTLAGTTLKMNVALRNLMQVTGAPLEELWQTASLNPARAINIADRKGTIEIGKDADLVMVDDALNVHLTIAQGSIAHRAAML